MFADLSSSAVQKNLPGASAGDSVSVFAHSSVRSLVIADASLADLDLLLGDLDPGTEVMRIEAGCDPLDMIANTLRSGYERLHFLGHGRPGAIRLGSRDVDAAAFGELAEVTNGRLASLHFWSCMTGATQQGRAFVDSLARAFGTAVTAFSGLVGAGCRGGSWTPDVVAGAVGPVESPFVHALAYGHTLDESTPGIIITDLGDYDWAGSVVVQDDGGLVVVGGSYSIGDSDFVVLRYTSSGALDPAFSGDGMVTTFFGWYDEAMDVVIQPDDKIVAVGHSYNIYGNGNLVLARYNTDGSLDGSFGSYGTVHTTFNDEILSQATSLALQTDGKIVVSIYGSGSGDFMVVRYNQDGTLDRDFGKCGMARTDIGGWDSAERVAVQSDGKILLAGDAYVETDWDFVVVRYNSDGSLDTTFDSDGIVMTDFGGTDSLSDMVLQPDGKIVVSGYNRLYSDWGYQANFVLARYNSDGSLDTTFGEDGRIVTPMDDYLWRGPEVKIQSDGKIVVSGTVKEAGTTEWDEDFVVLRYNTDGTLDASFGDGGLVVTDLGGDDIAESLVLQDDGKIVVTGYTGENYNDSDIAVVRYNSDGSLDTTFDGTLVYNETLPGSVVTSIRTYDEASSVHVQDDGSIVVAGCACTVASGDGDFAVVRYSANGSLDTSFDGDGVAMTGFGRYDASFDALVQPDGKYLAVGITADGSGGGDLAMARYNTSGILDTAFGVDGQVVSHFSGIAFEHPLSVALQTDGRIVVAGDTSGSGDFVVVRYDSDGSLDTGFGIGGLVRTDIGGEDESGSVVIQSDGKIVVAGMSFPPGSSGSADFAVVRYNGDGTLDTSFDADGKVATDFGQEDSVSSLALQSDGKLVVVGSSGDNIAIARYKSDGSLDTTFDDDGKLVTVLSGASEASDVVLQSDGKIIVTGVLQASAGSSGDGDFVVVRYNPDGSLDTGFGDGGKVVTNFGGNDAAESVALLPDGKIVVAGSTETSNGVSSDIAVVRYNSDGSLDTSFGRANETHPEWQHYEVPSGLVYAQGQYLWVDLEADALDADGDPVTYYGVPGYMDGADFIPGMERVPLEARSDGHLYCGFTLPDTTEPGDYVFRVFADDYTVDSYPGVWFDVPVSIIGKGDFYEIHSCDYDFHVKIEDDQFHFDFYEVDYYTYGALLTWSDTDGGDIRRESGSIYENGPDELRTELRFSQEFALTGDADHDGKPDGFYTEDDAGVDLIWQSRDEDGVVATFSVESGEASGMSGTVLDLDGDGEVDYARVTSPTGVTTMQQISFVDTDGDSQFDTLEVEGASVYILFFDGVGLYFNGHDYIGDGNFYSPVLSDDQLCASMYHYRGQGVIADVDAVDADGNLLVFTLDAVPEDGSGNPLFSINYDTGEVSLTAAGVSYVHAASLSETFDLTVRVTDGEHEVAGALTVHLRDTPERYDARVNVNWWNEGEGLDAVAVTLTEIGTFLETPATDEGGGQYGFADLLEGDYLLSVERPVDDHDREVIDLDDAYSALQLALDGDDICDASSCEYLAADVNRDGEVGFRDALGILKMALGRDDAPEPEWVMVPERTGYEPMSSDYVNWPDAETVVTMDQETEIDLIGVLLGDVDGSWSSFGF